MKNNPFEITFGLKPDNYISRLNQYQIIVICKRLVNLLIFCLLYIDSSLLPSCL